MNIADEREQDQAAYRQMKDLIASKYPPGRLVAIRGGKIVADAQDFQQLDTAITSAGFQPRDTLVVQAGVDYPESVVIF